MKEFIYSNNIGSFVFNLKGNIIDKRLYKSLKETKEASKMLSEGILTPLEKELIKKSNLPILGFKKNTEKCNIFFDKVIYAKVTRILLEKYRKEIRNNTIIVTKNDLKESVKKDILIVQAVGSLQEIDKAINTLSKRLREWYSYYLPEFSSAVNDNEKFSELASSKTRSQLLDDIGLKEEMSMGSEFSEGDTLPMKKIAEEIKSLFSLRKSQEEYIETVIKEIAPNMNAIAGALITAKLIAHAGSIERLSEFPASTVQILGAEKALFRHMKTGAKPPKYGVIINHPYVSKAKGNMKGKTSRILADKISIAAKVDYFKGDFVGDKLKKQIEKKLKV